MELEGRVAIVTGGATGLGAEVSGQLAAAGVRVGVNYSRSKDAAHELATNLVAPGGGAVRADVRHDAEIRSMVAEVERLLEGPVELLVNNAGVTTYVDAADPRLDRGRGLGLEPEREPRRNVAMRARGCRRDACPRGRSDRERGVGRGLPSPGFFDPYIVSKVGVVALTQILALAIAPVRVNAVAPGWMDTPRLDRYMPQDVVAALRRGEETASASMSSRARCCGCSSTKT